MSDRPCNRWTASSLQRVIVRFAAVSVLSAVCLVPPGAFAQADTSATDTPALAGPPNSRTHVVGEGDSLASIAKLYNLSLDSIKAVNSDAGSGRLEVGQLLLILPSDGFIHTAKSGESLRKVADRYSVKTEVIAQANGLTEGDSLEGGRQLFIPAGAGAVTVSASESDGKIDSRTYKVQEGDSLWTISQRFGVEPSLIIVDNDIKDPKSVAPGSRLRILPAKGVESVILKQDESMNDLATRYEIDLGALLDYNQLDSSEAAKAGARIVVPMTNARQAAATDAAAMQSPTLTKSQVAAISISATGLGAPGSDKGQLIASTALKYLGARYVFGGAGPSTFDCSGFAYFVHKSAGVPVGRTLWQQFNGGARVAKSQLQVGDEVFFANTYMPGLSHAGIYVGEGKFIHANNERTGVMISRMDDDYWVSRFVGAARIRG